MALLQVKHGKLSELPTEINNGVVYFVKDDNFQNGKIYYDSPTGEDRVDVSGVGYDVSGQELKLKEDASMVAAQGAEVFNDYRVRDFSQKTGNVATGEYSHAEGKFTTASGQYSHAEGYNSIALNQAAHAEGYETIASGQYGSHAEGWLTKATANETHAEGYKCEANAHYSHAEGYDTKVNSAGGHAEGGETSVEAEYSHAEGWGPITKGQGSHAEGVSTRTLQYIDENKGSGAYGDAFWGSPDPTIKQSFTMASGKASHAEGYNTFAKGEGSHSEGIGAYALGNYSHAEGMSSLAQGIASHTEGNGTQATGNYSHAEGQGNLAQGHGSHAEGCGNTAYGNYSHVGGYNCEASGVQSFAMGNTAKTQNSNSMAFGYGVTTSAEKNCQIVVGSCNTIKKDAHFIVGVGTSPSNPKNGFRVGEDGKCYAAIASLAAGADFAEYFEWEDQNINDEDRRGKFVTLINNKIQLANFNSDYILGVISTNGAFIGNAASEEWKDKYITNIFNEIQYQEVEYPAEYHIEKIEKIDEETGEIIIEEQKIEISPARIEKEPIINPEYDPSKEYISREFRKEWAPVGLCGQAIVVDDGTCEVNGYCRPYVDGIASSFTIFDIDENIPDFMKEFYLTTKGFKVIERLDDTHIKIIIK